MRKFTGGRALILTFLCACSPSDKAGTIIAKEGDGAILDSALADARGDAVVDATAQDATGKCVARPLPEPAPMNMACSDQLVPCINACAQNGDMQCVAGCWQIEPESCQACISERTLYCTSQGMCQSQYEAYFCCGEDTGCNADPETCTNDLCTDYRQSLQNCANADQTCVSQAIVECSPSQ